MAAAKKKVPEVLVIRVCNKYYLDELGNKHKDLLLAAKTIRITTDDRDEYDDYGNAPHAIEIDVANVRIIEEETHKGCSLIVLDE